MLLAFPLLIIMSYIIAGIPTIGAAAIFLSIASISTRIHHTARPSLLTTACVGALSGAISMGIFVSFHTRKTALFFDSFENYSTLVMAISCALVAVFIVRIYPIGVAQRKTD